MEGYRREAVWDPVTRLWHWLLAASVITGWILGEFRTFSIMQWHIYLGYLTGGLLVFRYVWGWIGPAPIRHRTLVASLRGIPAYLRRLGLRRPSGVAGHNPLGALSVIALVLALTAQVVTGPVLGGRRALLLGPARIGGVVRHHRDDDELPPPLLQRRAGARRPPRGRHPLLPRVEAREPRRAHAERPEVGEGSPDRGRVDRGTDGFRTRNDDALGSPGESCPVDRAIPVPSSDASGTMRATPRPRMAADARDGPARDHGFRGEDR